MGQDLIVMGVTLDNHPEVKTLRENATMFVRNLDDDDVEGACDFFVDDEENSLDEMRQHLLAGIDEINSWINKGARYVCWWEMDNDRVFVVAGGSSWGDSPFQEWDAAASVLALPNEALAGLGIYPGLQP